MNQKAAESLTKSVMPPKSMAAARSAASVPPAVTVSDFIKRAQSCECETQLGKREMRRHLRDLLDFVQKCPDNQNTADRKDAKDLVDIFVKSGDESIKESAKECFESMITGSFSNEFFFNLEFPLNQDGLIHPDWRPKYDKLREIFGDFEGEKTSFMSHFDRMFDSLFEQDARSPEIVHFRLPTVSLELKQIGGTCFVFAAVRSFNHR